MANEDNKDLLNFDSAEKKNNEAEEKENEVKETKKDKKPKTAIDKKKLITIIVAVVLVVIILPSGIYCIVHKENPVQMLTDTFSSSESQLVGKWQGASGVSAYEFNEDGTYKSYISSFDFSGTYTVDGKKYKLDFRLESKPTSKDLQRTIHVVYLKSNPKYAYCELTHLNYAISGWLLLIAGIVLSLIFIIGFIFSM